MHLSCLVLTLSCLAGALFGINYSFDPYLGLLLTFKGFVALTLGGIGSSLGSFIGGCLLGIVETMIAYFIGPVWSDIAAYIFFLMVLLTRP
ncbi:MAG: branched-chain amino acid ABC transporter permease, partial [candidate division WOR-3 bacterium]